MHTAQSPAKALKGLSFEVDDLTLIGDRSEANGLRMVVRLDYSSDVEEYEEVLALHAGTNPQYRWLMWRNANTVFVRSIDGRALRYEVGHPGNRRRGPQAAWQGDEHQAKTLRP